ncbi:hypothetical protein Nmel_012638 [Mimus melanotis]
MHSYLSCLKLCALLSKSEIVLTIYYTLEVTEIYQVSSQKAMLEQISTTARYANTSNNVTISSTKVMVRDLDTNKWGSPWNLITWRRGYVCVTTDTGMHWIPARCVCPAWNHRQHPPESFLMDMGEQDAEQ